MHTGSADMICARWPCEYECQSCLLQRYAAPKGKRGVLVWPTIVSRQGCFLLVEVFVCKSSAGMGRRRASWLVRACEMYERLARCKPIHPRPALQWPCAASIGRSPCPEVHVGMFATRGMPFSASWAIS